MESRHHPFQSSRPQLIPTQVPIPPEIQERTAALPLQKTVTRPLSDIRELSEPSVIDSIFPKPGNQYPYKPRASKPSSIRNKSSFKQAGSSKASRNPTKPLHARSNSAENVSSSYSSTPEQSSFYSIPNSSVPRRSSSQTHAHAPPKSGARKTSIRAASPPVRPKFERTKIPNRGQSRSPVKEARLRQDAVRSDDARRVPSNTYIRTPPPSDILEFPSHRHPRVRLDLQTTAPLFVGGGSVEGSVKVTVDENAHLKNRRSLGIGAISVDLLGYEDMSGGRRAIFLALGTELIDSNHPPPANMVEPANPLTPDEKFWTLMPSTSNFPFMISLPLDTGPPPFQSKHAAVRFLLCVTALVRDAGKHYRVRVSQPISVLATYDPEKALTSLPSPLTALDELSLPRFGRCESVKLTAGLHRQVWVSGSSIFADVHIANKSHKTVSRLEMALERDILCYRYAPAGTREKSASQARIFETNEQTMITRSILKPGMQVWNGVEAHNSETRTCELELPRGHATVRCGKYFEVRFFLNITASISNTKLVSVQLPIILIHMNSLDVLPNSVAQVAAAIEEKRAQREHHPSGSRQRSRPRQRSRTRSLQRSPSSATAEAELGRKPSYAQGRAFAAPRQQSADRLRAKVADVDELRQVLDSSPRKFQPQMQGTAIKKMGSSTSFGTVNYNGKNTFGGNTLVNMTYWTPPTTSASHSLEHCTGKPAESSRDWVRRMRSFDSIQSKKSIARNADQNADHGRPYKFTVVQNRIQPHTLGLTGANRRSSFDGPAVTRPGTSLSLREKLDRSRFEFKGVRRKATNASLRERGMNWLEHVKHRDKEKEGWI